MDKSRQSLIDKIVKMFRLGDKRSNTTEAEMMLAVSRARELMAKHAISEAEVARAKGEDIGAAIRERLRQVIAYTRRGAALALYDHGVANAVAVLTDTRCYISNTISPFKTVNMMFVGAEEDVELARTLFILWLPAVRAATRRAMGGGKNNWTNAHTSYAVGFAGRLLRRAQEHVTLLSQQDETTWGLVVQTKALAIKGWYDTHIKGPAKAQGYKVDASAYLKGDRDAQTFDMSRGHKHTFTSQTWRCGVVRRGSINVEDLIDVFAADADHAEREAKSIDGVLTVNWVRPKAQWMREHAGDQA